MELREYIHLFRRRWLLLLLIPLLLTVGTGIYSYYFIVPIYRATATVWVIKADKEQISQSDVMFNRSLVGTYAVVAKSRVVMEEAISRLGEAGVSVGALQGRLTVSSVRETEILSFTIVDKNPALAARMADAAVEAFKTKIVDYVRVENVVVVDRAIPSGPISPRPVSNMVQAAVVGLFFGIVLVLLLEYLDTTVKSPDDVAKHLGLPVLGMIPVIDGEESEAHRRRQRTAMAKVNMVVEK